MQVREHRRIKAKHLRQPYYFSRWYCCRKQDCKTTLVMPEEFKVLNQSVAGEEVPIEPDLVTMMLDEMAKEDGKR
jgi:hypothetical protein